MKEIMYEIWDEFPFIGSDDEETLQEKKKYWYKYAREVLEKLQTGNTALVADTAAGKTVIAILAIMAGDFHCLFLAPSRHLCGQHQERFRKVTGRDSITRVIIGTTPGENRSWNYPWEKVIFSTPHMAINELKRKKLDTNNFDLVIIDEFHKASGDYPYTKVMDELNSKTKVLALSASPGDSSEKIEQVGENCKIRNWITANIPTPRKLKDPVIAKQDEAIRSLSDCFEALLKNVLYELNELMPQLKLDPEENFLFGFTESEKWNKNANALTKERDKRSARFLIAKYIKLYHCYTTAIQESYASFLEYTTTLKNKKTKSGQNILAQKDFLKAVEIAGDNIDRHPKALMLLKVLKQWTGFHKNAIVFVDRRATGAYLKSFLDSHDIRAENIFGGGGKANLVKQEEALQKIGQRELDALISTSVIEEGISVPEVDMIVHYSRPSTGISSLQRDGRTGRLTQGNIVDLTIDHPLDRTDQLISKSKAKRSKNALEKRNKKKQIQLSLFPEE